MTNLQNAPLTAGKENEYWDLFDRDGNFVRRMRRGQGYVPPDLYHITVEIIATDYDGHLLITRRAIEKRRDGGFWEFPAGSVLSGEKPHIAALRELREETGLRPTKLRVFHKARVPGMIRIAYFAYVPDLQTATIRLQAGETMDYRIVTVAQWQEVMATGMFSRSRMQNYSELFFQAIEENVGMVVETAPEPKRKQTIRCVKFGEE